MHYVEVFLEWSNWVGRLGLNHLWQATIFFAVALLASLLLRRGSARSRYVLWLAASLKFALPSTIIMLTLGAAGINLQSIFDSSPKSIKTLNYISPVVSPLVVPPSYQAPTTFQQSKSVSNKQPLSLSGWRVLSLAGCAVWLLGAASFFLFWLKRRRQVTLAIKSGQLVRQGREWDALTRVKAWLGITRRIDLILTPEVKEPAVWRVWAPIVLLSETISSQLNDEELETLMMHELAHVLRWDNLVSNLNMMLCCIFWFNPIIWLIDNWLLKEREEACDEMVLRWSGTGEVYASSIKKIYRFCLISRVSGRSAAGGSKVKHRLERIVSFDRDVRPSPAQSALVGVVIFGSVTLTVIAAMQPVDHVVATTNSVLLQATKGLKRQLVTPETKDCAEPNLKKCLAPSSSAIIAQNTLGEVLITSNGDAPVREGATTIASLDEAPPAKTQSVNAAMPVAEQVSSFQSAHAVKLERFAGRYAVDPSLRENFVLDVSVEDGQLWLKPSHTPRRLLIAQSITDYLDSESLNTRITFTVDESGNVESLTLRGWGPIIVAPRLVLPSPSREGNVVFRLSDFGEAHIVAVAGTFNGWNQSQYLFERVGNEWTCRVSLPPGKYQYKFIVDGNWLVDPNNPTVVRDRRGIQNSQLIVQ